MSTPADDTAEELGFFLKLSYVAQVGTAWQLAHELDAMVRAGCRVWHDAAPGEAIRVVCVETLRRYVSSFHDISFHRLILCDLGLDLAFDLAAAAREAFPPSHDDLPTATIEW